MNIAGLVGALLPVFFVLALGYIAGKRHAFDSDQAAGLSALALGYALPASLFVGMTEIPKELLLQQGRLVLALVLSHDGLFVVAWLLLRKVKYLQGAASIIYALLLATSATPVFGIAVLQPLLGDTSAGTVGLVALAINLVVPAAIILLEATSSQTGAASAASSSRRAQVLAGLKSGLKSPLLWGPVLGIVVVLAGLRIPKDIAACFEMIGSATSGVAVFTVGLTLAAHASRFRRPCYSPCSVCFMYKVRSRARHWCVAAFPLRRSLCCLPLNTRPWKRSRRRRCSFQRCRWW
jgi:malonate transporter